MRHLLALAGAAALATVSVAAAAEAPAVKAGAMIYSSDGKRVGRVDSVRGDKVGLIIDQRYVYLPVSSLSPGENGRFVTSLTAAEARK